MKDMNFSNLNFKRVIRQLLIVAIFQLVLTNCMTITDVEQAESVNAGETLTIIVRGEVYRDSEQPENDLGGSELVFGFLAPTSWNVAGNAIVTLESVPFSQQLALMDPSKVQPSSDPEASWSKDLESRVGFGRNYGEMEWVMYEATEDYTPQPEEIPLPGTITIEIEVGQENLITQLGYFVGDNQWGIDVDNDNFSFFFTDCMEVINGEGSTINLCGDPPGPTSSEIAPETFSWNDIIHIKFNATRGANDQPTRLIGAGNVYWCAMASLQDGSTIERCDPSDKSEMKFQGDDIWSLTIWPPDFFDLENPDDIVSISYNFSNESQEIVVNNLSTGSDFILEANCD